MSTHKAGLTFLVVDKEAAWHFSKELLSQLLFESVSCVLVATLKLNDSAASFVLELLLSQFEFVSLDASKPN